MSNARRALLALGTGVALATFGVVVLEDAAGAAMQTFVVNTASDGDTGGCDPADCTLREAIVAANATPDLDTITFAFDPGEP